MKQYVCIKDGQIQILNENEIVERIKNGEFFQNYFEVGKEMELVIKLMPKGTPVAPAKKPAPKKKADNTEPLI